MARKSVDERIEEIKRKIKLLNLKLQMLELQKLATPKA